MADKKFVVQSLGANPKTPHSCRIHHDTMHVNYVTEYLDDTKSEFDSHQVEKVNITHTKEREIDEQPETGWIVEVIGEKARLWVSTDEDAGFAVEQGISAKTCFQLADMFTRAAEKILQEKGKRDAENARVKAITDSSKLPFSE